MRIFLGETTNESPWREMLKDHIKLDEKIDYFDPIVEDWTPDCIDIEEKEKELNCDVHLYVITSAMTGVYSIAEAVQSSNTKNKQTIFIIVNDGNYGDGQLRSLKGVGELIKKNGQGSYITTSENSIYSILKKVLV